MLKIQENPNKGKENNGAKIYKLTANKGYDHDLKRDRVALFAGIPSSYMNKGGDLVSYVTGKKITREGNEKDIHGKIVFRRGTLKVEGHEVDLLEFLDNAPWNKSNEKRDKRKKILFLEYNAADLKEAEYDYVTHEHDLVQTILELKGGDLSDIGRGFGVNVDQDDRLIQIDLINIAKENSVQFEEFMDSNEIKVKALISKSKSLKLIKRHRNLWQWTSKSGGNFNTICSVPAGKDPEDYLADFLMSPDGSDVRKELFKTTSKINEGRSEKTEATKTESGSKTEKDSLETAN